MYCQRKLFKKKRQIVVLLGAGAAAPWDGVTSENIKKSFIEHPCVQGDTTMGNFIFEILKAFYNLDIANFETFLAVLEELLNYTISLTNGGGVNVSNTSFIPAILELKESINNVLSNRNEIEKRQYCYKIFQAYVNLLIDEINNYNIKVLDEQYEKVNKNLVRFTKYFLSKNYSVKYYTTNYDNIIPQVLREHCNIYEGLYDDSHDEYRQFQYDLGLFRKARLSHFNLHGSIFLRSLFIKHEYGHGHGYETVYDNSGSHHLPEYALTEIAGNPGEPLLFSPVITGYNKTQRAANRPFSLWFNAFVNDCNDCDALCIVGYSMSDPHINAVLSSYIKWGNTRFIYITKKDIKSAEENTEFKNEFDRLNNEITQIIKKHSDKTWIHDDRKHVYRNGFDEFLKNKSNWEYLWLN